jgi:hypothetical protein
MSRRHSHAGMHGRGAQWHIPKASSRVWHRAGQTSGTLKTYESMDSRHQGQATQPSTPIRGLREWVLADTGQG